MGPMSEPKTKFTLRFDDPQTHDLLRLVADRLGVSMNQLAEEMIARELGAVALVVEEELTQTLQLLRDYRGGDAEEDAVAFGEAEASVVGDDPAQGRMIEVPTGVEDPFGVAAAFS